MKKFNNFYQKYGSIIITFMLFSILVLLLPIIPYLNLYAILLGGLTSWILLIWFINLIPIFSFMRRILISVFMLILIGFIAEILDIGYVVELVGINIFLLLFVVSVRLLLKDDEA